MNLFIKSYRISFIFFLFFTCVSGIQSGFAQQRKLLLSPWIQEINLPSLYSGIPNETFYCDRHGTLYIGKNNGLSIVDGGQNSFLPMEGPVYVSGDDSDTLYYVARNDLGFLVRDEGGTFQAISRKHFLPVTRPVFTPSGIQNSPGGYIIFTDVGLFRFSSQEIKFIETPNEYKVQTPADTALIKEITALMWDKTGIPAKDIKQLFFRQNTEIWILGEYTLHHIQYPSPLNLLEPGSVTTGRILKSMVSNGRILLGTTTGLFSVSPDLQVRDHWTITRLFPEPARSINMFSAVNDQVFAAGPDGLFLIEGEHAALIDTGFFTGIHAIRKGSLVASGDNGIVRYNQNSALWKSSLLNKSLQNSHSFTAFNNHIYFLCNKGVFRVNSRANRIDSVFFHSDELFFKLLCVEQDLILVTGKNVYRFDESEETFHPLPSTQRSTLYSESDIILPGTDDYFWILQNRGDYLSRVLYTNKLDGQTASFAAFPVLQNLGEIIDMDYVDSILFLTGKDKIALFDMRRLKSEPFEVSIHLPESDSVGDKQRFHFSGLELQRFPEPLFRYRLLPGNTSWSMWNPSRDYPVSGLRHGKYSIEMEAMDLYGRVTAATPLSFTVAPPFFLTWYACLVYGLLLLAGLFFFLKWRLLSYRRAESRVSERMEMKIQNLAEEKERSEKLVEDMLPEETADQMKNKRKAKWDKYERATVLFSDIQGFTKIAEEMNPEALIDELDTFFFHFDSVVEKYNIEKIKTIGDAYMAAGGIPRKNSTNPVEVVLAALEMQIYMEQLKSSRAAIWDLRIGIHTGPVIAGVVGHKKMSYDIWGDTVNTASRMESSGTPGKVNISGITYGMVKDYFLCEYRGKLPVKYKGNIDMYYVNGLRPELSVDLKGIPNKRFFLKLQLLRLGDLEEKVIDDVLTNLPETIHFHTPEYARKVYNQSFLLCRSEEIEEEDRLLVRTAALMLYTGLTQDYHNFENRSSVISREILPEFSYSDRQIDQICNLILATKLPFSPNNLLEKILIDSRMEFIGRPDYTTRIRLLHQELKETGSKINGQQFKKQQLELLFDFQFYTVAAKRLREVSGAEQMSRLEQERWI